MDSYVPLHKPKSKISEISGKFKPFRFIDDPQEYFQHKENYHQNNSALEQSERSDCSKDLYTELLGLRQVLKETKYANSQLSDQNDSLGKECEELKRIMHKQNALIDTMRTKYSTFCKKLTKQNNQYKFQLQNNQDCYAELSQQFRKIQAENDQMKVDNKAVNEEARKTQALAKEVEAYKKTIQGLYKDKKDLKNEVKGYKKRIKKYKHKYRALHKALNNQKALKAPYSLALSTGSIERAGSLDHQTNFYQTLRKRSQYPNKINHDSRQLDSHGLSNVSMNKSCTSRKPFQKLPSNENSYSRNRYSKDSLYERSIEDSRSIHYKQPDLGVETGNNLKPFIPNSISTPQAFCERSGLVAYSTSRPGNYTCENETGKSKILFDNTLKDNKFPAENSKFINKPNVSLSDTDYLDKQFIKDNSRIQTIRIQGIKPVNCGAKKKASDRELSIESISELSIKEESSKTPRTQDRISNISKKHHRSREFKRYHLNSAPLNVDTSSDEDHSPTPKHLLHQISTLDSEILTLQKSLMQTLFQTT
ncbi:unnamed protein product [Moneuplotes crassus]|uniref:Uncharacterized protein n=1 Tax=Euplotes crassus TaxID=5936 RepID=A0AAD1X3Z8_EUPCR|nr:unnamed protein product [Moneuplotes crassus]